VGLDLGVENALEDVEAIPRLAERMLERLCVPDPKAKPFGRLTLSISSFVPKPWTPFQWAPFAGAGALQAKLEIVKHGVRRLHNVRVLHENPREAALQALLAPAIGASPTFSSSRRRSPATGGARSGSGRATPTSARRGSARRTSGCRGITSTWA